MMAKPYVVQIYENRWYLDKFDQHECCCCGAQHKTEYKVEKGRIFTRWTLDPIATKANRLRDGVAVIKTRPKKSRKEKP